MGQEWIPSNCPNLCLLQMPVVLLSTSQMYLHSEHNLINGVNQGTGLNTKHTCTWPHFILASVATCTVYCSAHRLSDQCQRGNFALYLSTCVQFTVCNFNTLFTGTFPEQLSFIYAYAIAFIRYPSTHKLCACYKEIKKYFCQGRQDSEETFRVDTAGTSLLTPAALWYSSTRFDLPHFQALLPHLSSACLVLVDSIAHGRTDYTFNFGETPMGVLSRISIIGSRSTLAMRASPTFSPLSLLSMASGVNIHCVSKKVPTFKLPLTLSNLNQFSKILHCWKAHEICYKTGTTLPTSP